MFRELACAVMPGVPDASSGYSTSRKPCSRRRLEISGQSIAQLAQPGEVRKSLRRNAEGVFGRDRRGTSGSSARAPVSVPGLPTLPTRPVVGQQSDQIPEIDAAIGVEVGVRVVVRIAFAGAIRAE